LEGYGGQDALKKRGFLGAALSQADDALRVDRVVPGSPAEKAGLAAGDLVVKLDGAPVTTVAAFVKAMQEHGAGGDVRLSVTRDGKALDIALTLARHPQDELEEPDTSEGLRKVRKTFDLAYYTGERHKLNLILPETDKPFPTVMWIHAGAWSFGDRAGETALGVRLAERGIGFAAISHRLTGGAWMDPKLPKDGVQHPAHVEDCARAFAWLHTNIKERGGDPALLFVAGHSSGAHLAALLAMDPRYLKAHDLPLSAVRGAIPIGAYDVPKYHAHLVRGMGKERADAHVSAIFGELAAWAAASPVAYAKDSKVPILVITEDVEGFRLYRDDFKAGLPESAPVVFWTAEDRRHETITALMARKEADAPRDRMVEFVREKSGR